MRRLTDNDKTLGPFIVGRWHGTFSIGFHTSGDDEDRPDDNYNFIRLAAFGWVLQVILPCMLQPFRKKIEANWDEATVKRLGRNYYYDVTPKVYEISLSNLNGSYDFLQVKFGIQTDDSRTEKSWCCHLPWLQWENVRNSVYEPDGKHYATELSALTRKRWSILNGLDGSFWEMRKTCPKSYFMFDDYDGDAITATCMIQEYEWHRGVGWFKWLRYFFKPKIRRSLNLEFNAEVGPEKGSWKGGTLGHGIEMLPGERPIDAFKRYCEMEHRSKYRPYKIKFIGIAPNAEKCPF